LAFTWLRAIPVLLALAVTGGAAWAGEKIQFSGRSDKDGPAPSPLDAKTPFAAPNFLQGLKPTNPNPIVQPGPASTGSTKTLSKEELDKLEKKRNWAFQKPDQDRDKDKSKPEADEREDDNEAASKRPKNSIDKFLTEEEQKRMAGTRGPTNRTDNARRVAERPEQNYFGATGTNGTGRAGQDLTGGPGNNPAATGLPAFGSSRTENIFQPLTGEREKPMLNLQGSGEFSGIRKEDSRLEEFRKLLAPTPINGGGLLPSDLTRKEANPLTGQGVGGREGLNLLGTFGGGPGDAPGKGFDPLNLGGSTPLVQPDPARLNAKPAVLEIPKRVF
jgi:hypothetical protein